MTEATMTLAERLTHALAWTLGDLQASAQGKDEHGCQVVHVSPGCWEQFMAWLAEFDAADVDGGAYYSRMRRLPIGLPSPSEHPARTS